MRVLVVEDEAPLARTVQRGLIAAGFAVDLAPDGDDALWAAGETAYDVIVLDLMLPTMDGHRVIELLRERDVWTPVLVLTARPGTGSQVSALDSGADDYLTKPFDFPVLVARLRALVRRGAPARPHVLMAGALRLDPARRTVTRQDTDIRLTAREFEVLEFLMRRKGEVVSKTEIMANVWSRTTRAIPTSSRSMSGTCAGRSTCPLAPTRSARSVGRATCSTTRGTCRRTDWTAQTWRGSTTRTSAPPEGEAVTSTVPP